jgi:hypothetical protein
MQLEIACGLTKEGTTVGSGNTATGWGLNVTSGLVAQDQGGVSTSAASAGQGLCAEPYHTTKMPLTSLYL